MRRKGVVGKFVEFYGQGCSNLPVAVRTTIGNMSPEYGSTIAIFPIDEQTLTYLRLTGRNDEQIALVEAYAKAQGMFRTDASPEPRFSDTLELDMSTVEPNLAGPRRPQDRVPLKGARVAFEAALEELRTARRPQPVAVARLENEGGGGTAVAAEVAVEEGAPLDAACRRAARRLDRHRGDHVVHEYLEPGRADRRRTAGKESGRTRAHSQAVGQDVARAGLESRHRLPRQSRA